MLRFEGAEVDFRILRDAEIGEARDDGVGVRGAVEERTGHWRFLRAWVEESGRKAGASLLSSPPSLSFRLVDPTPEQAR